MNYKKLEDMIDEYIKKEHLTRPKFCHSIGITNQALNRMMRLKAFKLETMERIADKLNVSPCIFFDEKKMLMYAENNNIDNQIVNENNSYYIEINRLKNEIKLKDNLIESYHLLISNRKKN
jgi:DNA-binding Xre family transcriptional regulator